MFSEDNLLLNCKMMPNARTKSSDGYFECEYTKVTSGICTSVKKTLINYATLITVGAMSLVHKKCSCSE